MNITGNNVVLRALEPEDMPYLLDMINDPEMEYMVVGWSFPNSKKQQDDWYSRIVGDQKNFRFAIELKERGSFLLFVEQQLYKGLQLP